MIDVNHPSLQATPSSDIGPLGGSADYLGASYHYPMASHCGTVLQVVEPIAQAEGFFSYPAMSSVSGGEGFQTMQSGSFSPSMDLASATQGYSIPSAGYAF
jgi:hypothetical protein